MKTTMCRSEAPPRLLSALIGRLGRYRLAVLTLALLGSATASRASMIIRVTEDPSAPGATNGSTLTFTFTGDGQAPVLTSADFGGGSGTFGNFTILTISATSNSGTVGPQASLTSNISAIANAAGTAHILEVDITDTNFTFPPSGSYKLSSSASDTNAGTSVADSHGYQSFFSPGSTPPFGTAFPAPPISLSLGDGSTSAVTTHAFFSSSQPFSLTSYTIFDSVSGGGLLNTTDSTIVTVPEPATAVLMGLGVGILGLKSWSRRRACPAS